MLILKQRRRYWPGRHTRAFSLRGAVSVLSPLIVVAVLLLVYRLGWRSGDPLVVYCAHDALFSRAIIETFEQTSGIRVDLVLDNETTKSLGLTERLIAEKANPRCDVFWNNQWLGTADLADRGILHPYKGAGFRRIPQRYKDPQGRFAGFAARLRVYIVNTQRMPADREQVDELLRGDLRRVAIAKPLWGTTLTHYTVLWDLWGPEAVKAWRAEWQQRGVIEARSNSATKNLVAQGQCDLGFTDTDDFFVAADAGDPVAMLPVRLETGQVICIPNTVAIIRGTKRLKDAQKLVDFLLSQRVEMELAASKSRQIPLGPVDESQLSPEVRQLQAWSANSYDLRGLNTARRQVYLWLKSQLLR